LPQILLANMLLCRHVLILTNIKPVYNRSNIKNKIKIQKGIIKTFCTYSSIKQVIGNIVNKTLRHNIQNAHRDISVKAVKFIN
jgi:uncharacterized Zn-finger protein